jgi:hypothetical protein
MQAETMTFLRALYDGVEGGFLTFTAIHPDKQHAAPSRHVPINDEARLADTLARLCTANAQGWGAYFSVATRKANLGRWRRGGKCDLGALPALFVDIDGDPDAARRQLDAYGFPPSCIVSSGGGIHAYWFIQATPDWRQVDLVLAGLANALNGDKTNAAQALRLPGTLNTKPTRNGASCRIIALDPERRYTLSDFPTLKPACKRSKISSSASHTHERINSDLLHAVADCLCAEFRGYVKANGYIAALCPCGHCRDYPGSHFNFDPVHGIGMCFGRHGRLLLKDLCSMLRIEIALYGGFFQ